MSTSTKVHDAPWQKARHALPNLCSAPLAEYLDLTKRIEGLFGGNH